MSDTNTQTTIKDPPFSNLPQPLSTRPKVITRLNKRRQAILDIYARFGRYTTVREVIRRLNEAGIRATLGSTHRDRVFLGLAK